MQSRKATRMELTVDVTVGRGGRVPFALTGRRAAPSWTSERDVLTTETSTKLDCSS